MGYLWAAILIAGGILGCAGLIVAKKPDAKELIGKLQPFQAGIGLALLGFGIWNLLDALRMLSFVGAWPLAAGATAWVGKWPLRADCISTCDK